MIALVALLAAALIADPAPSPAPSPASSPTAAPTTVYAGQVLDIERGYIVFSTGDALKLAPGAPLTDAVAGTPWTEAVVPGLYGAAAVEADGTVSAVRLSRSPIVGATPIAAIPRALVAQATPAYGNPDLIPPPTLFPPNKLSKTEGVTVTVAVPPETPFADQVYMATDTSGWNPEAVQMQRVDGRHFRATMSVMPGTRFHFLFTRGSWATVETDASGLRRSPRLLDAQGQAVLSIDATVARWTDIP